MVWPKHTQRMWQNDYSCNSTLWPFEVAVTQVNRQVAGAKLAPTFMPKVNEAIYRVKHQNYRILKLSECLHFWRGVTLGRVCALRNAGLPRQRLHQTPWDRG